MISLCLTVIDNAEYREQLYHVFFGAAEPGRSDVEFIFEPEDAEETADAAQDVGFTLCRNEVLFVLEKPVSGQSGNTMLPLMSQTDTMREKLNGYIMEYRGQVRPAADVLIHSIVGSSKKRNNNFQLSKPITVPIQKNSAPKALPLLVSDLVMVSNEVSCPEYMKLNTYGAAERLLEKLSENPCAGTYDLIGRLREIGKRWKYRSGTILKLLKEYLCSRLSVLADGDMQGYNRMFGCVFRSKKSVCLLS